MNKLAQSYSLLILSVVLPACLPEAEAKKIALVIGGSAKETNFALMSDPPSQHEFGQASARVAYGLTRQGYEVTTLFDSVSTTPRATGESADEQNAAEASRRAQASMGTDFEKFRSLGAQSASEANVIAALRRVLETASPGDEFELNLFAHGYRACGDDTYGARGWSSSPESSNNQNADCRHVISVSDPVTGQTVLMDTARIAEIVREIDAKGIKTNVLVSSCHSGAAQELFQGLPNTCTSFIASANNVGYGCFPSDEPGDLSYTSTADMIMASHYARFASDMLNDPYFKQDPCLAKVTRHFTENNIAGSSRYDLFMSARRHDQTMHEPTLSSQLDRPYFTHGNLTTLSSNLYKRQSAMLCYDSIESRVTEMMEFGSSVANALVRGEVQQRLHRMRASIDRYNQLVAAQAPLLAPSVPEEESSNSNSKDLTPPPPILPPPPPILPPRTDESRAQLAVLQGQIAEAAASIVSMERELIDLIDQAILRPTIPENDPCLRRGPA